MARRQRDRELSSKTRDLFERARSASSRGKRKSKSSKSSFDAYEFVDQNLDKNESKKFKKFLKEADDYDKSQFQETFNALMKYSASAVNEFKSDDFTKNTQRAMLTLILNMIPKAEEACLRDMKQSNAYALNSFIDQARSLADDLNSASNAGDQHFFIFTKIITPMFLHTANTLLSEMSALKAVVDTEVSDKHAKKEVKRNIDEVTRSLGKFLSEAQNGIGERLLSYLQGDLSVSNLPTELKTRRKRKNA